MSEAALSRDDPADRDRYQCLSLEKLFSLLNGMANSNKMMNSIRLKLLISIILMMLTQGCYLTANISNVNEQQNSSDKGINDPEAPSGDFGDAPSATLSSANIINNVNKSACQFSGSCVNLSSIEIQVNGSSVGIANCASGLWSLTSDYSGMADGSISFRENQSLKMRVT